VITPASFVGFGLVLLGTSVAISFLACTVFLTLRSRLRRVGPHAERAAAALAICLPPLLGAGIAGALVLGSFLGGALGTPDHCPAHDHHLHLCLYHGASWAERAWAVATLAGACTGIAYGVGRRLVGWVSARRAVQRLSRVSRPLAGGSAPVSIAPADQAFCFTAGGLRPQIFVSTAAWDALDSRQREAVVEHELAHVAQKDVWIRSWLGVLALLGAPLLPRRILAAWALATERACDQRAARAVGDPSIVAEALLKLARLAKRPAPVFAASFASPADLAARVESLLADGPDGAAAARRFGWVALGSVVVGFCVAGAFVDPLHHAIETLLGGI
jgi:Zn-dependent protease with chaperone function